MRTAEPRARALLSWTDFARLLLHPSLLERAIALWLFLAIAVCAKTLYQPHEHTVYPIFAQAARDWWHGEPLYANQAYFYSPTFAVAMSGFAWLPDAAGGIAWQLVSIAALLAALRMFYRHFLAPSFGTRFEPHYLTLCLIASVRGVWSAQSNTLLLALLLCATVAAARSRWWTAALCLALPVHIKLWPLALAALLCARWPRKLFARFALVVLALALVPFFAATPQQAAASYGNWYDALAARQTSGMRFPGYRDAWTITDTLDFTVHKQAQLRVQVAAGAAVLVWTLWLRRRRASAALVHTLAGWAAWQVLLGPGSERLAYMLLAPTMSWAILRSFVQHRGRALIVCAYAGAFIFGSGVVERSLTPLLPAAVMIQPWGALLFAAWLVLYASRVGETHRQRESPATIVEYRIARNGSPEARSVSEGARNLSEKDRQPRNPEFPMPARQMTGPASASSTADRFT